MSKRVPSESVVGLPKRYSNLQLIGSGGSGRVFRAHDTARNTTLALKLVGPAEAAWLRREFDTLRQIRHENLVRVFDWGTMPTGGAYYTMELIDGGDWGARLGSPQPAEEVRRILAGIARGLAHLHAHGEVHGDLKPGNVLLGRGNLVKVSDVGMTGDADPTKAVSGTPGYAAPEIWEGAKPGNRSDIYSVGVLAYEALTGHHPFAGRTIKEVVSGQLAGWVASPRTHCIQLPPDLERAVMRALDRNPSLRPGSADEFMEEFGVVDRVGEILGGKIVGRDRDIEALERLITADEPGLPTLVYVTGPPGVGKTALLDEFGQRLLARGGNVVHATSTSLAGIVDAMPIPQELAQGPQAGPGEMSISSVVGAISDFQRDAPTLLLFPENRSDDGRAVDLGRSLARFLWASSVEKDRGQKILVGLTPTSPPSNLEEFEQCISLEPIKISQFAEFMSGTLGQMVLEPEVLAKLHAVTGGSPRAIRAIVADVIDRGILNRIAGTWRFREVERLGDLAAAGAASRWSLAWGHLSMEQREAVALLSRFPKGLTHRSFEAAIPGAADLLPELTSTGWVQATPKTWMLASEEIRGAVLDLEEETATAAAERRLLEVRDDGLTREERATILLRLGDPKQALDEGFWAAEQSVARGEFRQALERAERCLGIAESLKNADATRRAALLIGQSLHQSGSDEEAGEILEREAIWGSGEWTTPQSAARAHLLGTIKRAQSRMSEARAQLSTAIGLAEASGDLSTFLRAHAELAEIDWRHGDEAARNGAMERVRAALDRPYKGLELNDERASLSYQLGSALIVSGSREAALDFLMRALALSPGDFWRMRLSNAIATAHYYLGDFGQSLSWLDEAWRCAERGGIDAFKARILSNRAGMYYGLGRFRDAVEGHELSAQWGRRTGNVYEVISARLGGSVNLTFLGRYDEAIARAREGLAIAERIGSFHEAAKALELEALTSYYIGSYAEAARIALVALERTQGQGFDDVVPRLNWLRARVSIETGDLDSAQKHLSAAESVLKQTKDWEDLPGVQIEMQRVLFRKKDSRFNLEDVNRLAENALRSRALIVYLQGALLSAEVVDADGVDDRKGGDFLVEALGRAEESGAAEFSWRLSHVLGELAIRRSDMRGASGRFAHAVRRLGEVADRLRPEHRQFYLKTAHARRLLERASAVTQSGT